MQWMKQVFAQRYNALTGRSGHIWGDRYWSQILEGEPPEGAGATAGAAAASGPGTGDRPRSGKNAGKPGFPPIFPAPTAPSSG
jgi:hypothetical protein